jgi:hypothetical protein
MGTELASEPVVHPKYLIPITSPKKFLLFGRTLNMKLVMQISQIFLTELNYNKGRTMDNQ